MDKFKLEMSVRFKRDVKRCKKRGLPLDELWDVIRTLLRGEKLAPKYKAHILTGDHKGEWECHIQPDWLLLWEQHDDQLVPCLTPVHIPTFTEKSDDKYLLYYATAHLHTRF